MSRDRFKSEIAECTVRAFKEIYPESAKSVRALFIADLEKIAERLEMPKKPEMGNFALPLFELAKVLKKNPNEINLALVEAQNLIAEKDYPHLSFSAVGGFNNVRIETGELARATVSTILKEGGKYGSSDEGRGKNAVIDFSSPNIAKPFGIGHLRSTAIGHSLYRIFEKLGYRAVGINHLGDWGTQFGKMIVAFRRWGDEEELKVEPVEKLYNLYVRIHREEKADPKLADEARAAFKALEEGRTEETELWKRFREFSLQSFNKTYDRLGIKFDHYHGESFYNDKIEATIQRLDKAGLTKISQGALIVDLEKYDLPPCILRKADGATLYATRDIAGIIFRFEEFDFDKALYVVGSAQRDHFRQVFKVIELLEEAEKTPPEKRCANRLKHVEFGWIKFKDEMMSTRLGNIILLDDVLNRAVELARKRIQEKNPDLNELDRTAEQIGIGAVLFADMSSRRHKDVNFDWDELLNFEGETGPYLQYTHARLASLRRRYGAEISMNADYSLLDRPEENRILDLLYKFPWNIEEAARTYEPYIIGAYLIQLAAAFNRFYQRKDRTGRIDKIISDDETLTVARMALVEAVRKVIEEGLRLLGIEAPDEM
jgi:arginyl-tRNA synthetase